MLGKLSKPKRPVSPNRDEGLAPPRRSVCAPAGLLSLMIEQTTTAKEILMVFQTQFDSSKSGSSRTPGRWARHSSSRRRPAACRLGVEALEDRCLLSTDIVYSALYSGITRNSTAGANGIAIDIQRNAYMTGGLADDTIFA